MSDVTISKDILDEYYKALWSVQDNYRSPAILSFRLSHPDEYRTISAMHRKRTQLKKDIKAMWSYSHRLAWFTLTYDQVKDKNTERYKRKEAFEFLNGVFKMFNAVEEYGEQEGRYHIHGFGVFLDGKDLEDFYEWHSREEIRLLNNYIVEKKIKYLTNYATKNVPRLRRNRTLNAYRKKVDNLFDPVFAKNFPSLQKQRLYTEAFLLDLE